mgnify:FL=1|jgi:hypothetical protein
MSTKKTDLNPYVHAIRERFEPTENESKATHKLSTKEVADAINELNPGCNATTQDVYDALFEAGFVFRALRGTLGLNFKWLMIEK